MKALTPLIRFLTVTAILLTGKFAYGSADCLHDLHALGQRFLEKHEITIDEYRAHRRDLTGRETILLTRIPEVAEIIEYMQDGLVSFHAREPDGIADGINRLRKDLRDLHNRTILKYDTFLEVAYRFSAAVSLKSDLTYDQKNLLIRNLWSGSNGFFDRLELERQDNFLLPTHEELTLAAINFLRAQNVIILPLSEKVQNLNGRAELPFAIFAQDLEQAFKIDRRGEGELPSLSQTERPHFYKAFSDFTEVERNPRDANLMQSLWYIVFTRLSYPMHPKSLSLAVHTMSANLEEVQRMFNQNSRLEQEFDRPVGLGELSTALTHLESFATSLNGL